MSTASPSRRRPTVLALTAWVAFAMAAGTLASAPVVRAADPSPTLPPTLDTAPNEDGPDPFADQILVRYRPGTTPGQRLAVRQANGLQRVPGASSAHTDVVVAPGRSTATIRRHLADASTVVAVDANHQRELADDISGEPGFPELWGLHNRGQTIDGIDRLTGVRDVDIDALEALRLTVGDPEVIVAVIDDGVDTAHPDLEDAIWTNPGEAGAKATNGIDDDGNGYIDDVHGWDFCNDDKTVHDAGQDGHGTHVAGTIAASLNGSGVVGVAPGVKIMPLKFIDAGQLCGADSQAVAAIDYAASFGVHIINASWGGYTPSSVLHAAIADSGALFVAASGNGDINGRALNLDRSGGMRFYPASWSLTNIVAVAAVDQRGRLAPFSNYGRTSVDLGAPGTNILSTYPAFKDCPSPCYAWNEGTSMAAPHVTGVAALVASHEPSLRASPLKLRSRLLATGMPLSSLSTKTSSGRLVNAWRAVDAVPPVVKPADRFAVPTGSTIGSTSTRLRVQWPAATDALSTVASYRLKKRAGGSWTTVVSATTSRSATTTVRFGQSTLFRLSAKDAPGSTSAGKDSPAVTASLYSDGASLVRYGSGWKTSLSSSALGGKLHTARKTGAKATISFTGRAIAIIAPRSSSRGSFKVLLDGTEVATVNLRHTTVQSRRAVYSVGWPTKAAHTVTIVATSGRRIDLDGFVIVR